MVKNLPANAGDRGDVGSIPRSGRSPGGGNGNPLQYFFQNGKRTEEPGRPQSEVCKESDKTEQLNMHECMPGVKSAEMI